MGDEPGYSGAVGPSRMAVRRVPDVEILKISVGPMDNNAYLVRCVRTGEALLVDAANEAERLLDLVAGDPLRFVVTTHRHADHWQALAAVVAATGATTVAHPDDAAALPVPTGKLVRHGDVVTVGRLALQVVHVRGHTPGSIVLRLDASDRTHLWTGDSLFPGGPGNTFGDAAAFRTLMTDLQERVFDVSGDDTWVYPGHGADTTLGDERAAIPSWWARGW